MPRKIYYYARSIQGQNLSAEALISASGLVASAASITIRVNRRYLAARIIDGINEPSGYWMDFNASWKNWNRFSKSASHNGFLSIEESRLLQEPSPSDYISSVLTGDIRFRNIQKIKTTISVNSLIEAAISVDGWVGSGPAAIVSESNLSATAQNLISSRATIGGSGAISARLVPDEGSIGFLSHLMAEPIRNKSGRWSDFNRQYKRYLGLQKLVASGFMRSEELPDPPNPADYSDLS